MSGRIPSPNYTSGRAARIRVVVLHTAQTPCQPGRARGIANFLSGSGVGASCHWAVDPDDEVQQVLEGDTAWAAPGANADGVQIEQAAYAEFSPADWASPEAKRMLERTARLVAAICQRHGLPIKALSNGELAAGAAGVVHHVQVSEVYQRSDHWDCGGSFPIAAVVARAREIAGGSPPPEEEDLTPEQAQQLKSTEQQLKTTASLVQDVRNLLGDVYNNTERVFDHDKNVGLLWDVRMKVEEAASYSQWAWVKVKDANLTGGGGGVKPIGDYTLQELFAKQQEFAAEIQRRMSAKDESAA